jgi:hypothetical protein
MQPISNRETKATGDYLKPTQLQQQLTNEGEIMLEISTKVQAFYTVRKKLKVFRISSDKTSGCSIAEK